MLRGFNVMNQHLSTDFKLTSNSDFVFMFFKSFFKLTCSQYIIKSQNLQANSSFLPLHC